MGTIIPLASDPTRASEIKKIHAMARELAMSEDCYRALISGASAGRTESSSALTHDERREVIDRLRRLGAGKRRRGGSDDGRQAPLAMGPEARKARALWLALWHLGEIADGSEGALTAFVRRQSGVQVLQWMRGDDAGAVIDALKAMCARADFAAPATAGTMGPKAVAVLMGAKRDLVRAIWRRLGRLGALRIASEEALDVWLSHRVGGRRTGIGLLGGEELDAAAAGLGQWLRRAMAQRGIEAPLSAWLRAHR